jgi:hypothetical protein
MTYRVLGATYDEVSNIGSGMWREEAGAGRAGKVGTISCLSDERASDYLLSFSIQSGNVAACLNIGRET